jgi:AcrR family transcriptional regulator
MAFRQPTLEKKEEKGRVRAALLRAALHLGARHGFAGLGLREVAREAGIAPTSFYRHFSDMQELGAALIREPVGAAQRGIGQAALSGPRARVVSSLVEATLRTVREDPELVRFVVAERVGAFEALRALLRAEVAALAGGLHAALARVAGADVAVPPQGAAELAVALLLEGSAELLDDPAEGRADAVRQSLEWGLTRLLGPAFSEGEG